MAPSLCAMGKLSGSFMLGLAVLKNIDFVRLQKILHHRSARWVSDSKGYRNKDMEFLDTNKLLYTGLRQVINRGTAEVLEEDGQGIFLRDTVSNVFMLAANDFQKSVQWLEKHENRQYPLLVLFRKDTAAFAQERYQLSEKINCYQAVYTLAERPAAVNTLQVETASETDFPMIASHYHMLSDSELQEVIRRGELFIGRCNGEAVGFIGQHLEGSMGLLEIFPQHRGKGYGTELESWMIGHMLEKGLIPYCQVVEGNGKSFRLQKKLGLTFSDEPVYWVY